jgi:uncharacterized protein YjbJ (UPF0337 family)
MNGPTTQAKSRANKQAGAVRQLAGRIKRDRGLEARGLAQRTKVALQGTAGTSARRVAG